MGTNKSLQENHEWLEWKIKNFFKKNPISRFSKKSVIAQMCVERRISIRTATEIFKVFVDSGLLKVEGNDVGKGKKWRI